MLTPLDKSTFRPANSIYQVCTNEFAVRKKSEKWNHSKRWSGLSSWLPKKKRLKKASFRTANCYTQISFSRGLPLLSIHLSISEVTATTAWKKNAGCDTLVCTIFSLSLFLWMTATRWWRHRNFFSAFGGSPKSRLGRKRERNAGEEVTAAFGFRTGKKERPKALRSLPLPKKILYPDESIPMDTF